MSKRIPRREALGLIGAAGAALAFGCQSNAPTSPTETGTGTSTGGSTNATCATDANGQVTFVTVYPGWYQGRATHIHVEVVRNGVSTKVTQIAFPESTNAAVYGTGVYASRGANPTSNTRDGIFADSLSSELATVAGDPTTGLTANFQVSL